MLDLPTHDLMNGAGDAWPKMILITDSPTTARQVTVSVHAMADVEVWPFRMPDGVLALLGSSTPRCIAIDFEAAHRQEAMAIAAQLRHGRPEIPLVGVGHPQAATDAIAALRAGVQEFLPLGSTPQEAMNTLQQLLSTQVQAFSSAQKGQALAVFGARPGVGSSTLTVHLATAMQRASQGKLKVLVIDMGLPVGDSHIMLGTKRGYNLVQLAKILERIDPLFLESALNKNKDGIASLALPDQIAELKEVTPAVSLALIDRLRGFYDLLIIDLGGFTNPDFAATVANKCNQVLLLTDQSAPSIVSANQWAQSLGSAGVALKLVVSRFNAKITPSDVRISERLDLPLLTTLPDRRRLLVNATNAGKTIFDVDDTDAYAKAVRALAQVFMPEAVAVGSDGLTTASGTETKTKSGLSTLWSKLKPKA